MAFFLKALRLRCPTCGARPHQFCFHPNMRRLDPPNVHQGRIDLITRADSGEVKS
jgi:hypothetical protein